jgi:threonine dehydratase
MSMTAAFAPPVFDDVKAAAARLEGLAVRTPLIWNPALDEAAGGRVLVKAECLQRTGSFKFRGAYNALARIPQDRRAAGVVAFSSGNHAQGVAEAAKLLGMPATIVMPADAPAIKAEGVRARGAQVVSYDRETENREEIAAALAAERGAALIPSYDHPDVIAGQGTCGLEVFEDLAARGEKADALVCCVSGGGLIGGINLAAEALSPNTEVWSAEPEGFDDHARSLAAGDRVSNAKAGGSVQDALLASTPGALTYQINARRLTGGAAVTDAEALSAVRFAWKTLKIVLEPGGACALAALLTGKVDGRGRTTVIIASGGNADPALFAKTISG